MAVDDTGNANWGGDDSDIDLEDDDDLGDKAPETGGDHQEGGEDVFHETTTRMGDSDIFVPPSQGADPMH